MINYMFHYIHGIRIRQFLTNHSFRSQDFLNAFAFNWIFIFRDFRHEVIFFLTCNHQSEYNIFFIRYLN